MSKGALAVTAGAGMASDLLPGTLAPGRGQSSPVTLGSQTTSPRSKFPAQRLRSSCDLLVGQFHGGIPFSQLLDWPVLLPMPHNVQLSLVESTKLSKDLVL